MAGAICYARSTDGRVWTKYNGPNSDSSFFTPAQDGSGCFALVAPNVMKDGSIYRMWYSMYSTTGIRIAYATSPNGITWTKVAGTGTGAAVVDLGASIATAFDAAWAAYPSVLKTAAGFEMWYTGLDGSGYRVGYATSPDGKTWTKYSGSKPKGSLMGLIHQNIPPLLLAYRNGIACCCGFIFNRFILPKTMI